MYEREDLIGLTEILGWKDITTNRQKRNGTQIWELPIKNGHSKTKIRVGSFKSGYLRRMNHCYTPYQLNKCKPTTEYYKDYKWNEESTKQIWTGKYRKCTGKARIIIPDERDRLEYLIDYAIKNYYIGYANQVANGKFVDKWRHEWELKQEHARVTENGYLEPLKELSVNVNGQRYKVI